MKRLLSIAYYTLIENVRNKVFYVLILFGTVVITASLLLAALGGEQQVRVLLDLGLSAIEFFSLLTVGFAAVTLVLEEMETRTIYLVLTRPVSRAAYLAGRFAGLLCAVYLGMLAMSLLHVGVLLVQGWEFTFRYPLSVLLSAGKIAVIGAVALFFSLFSSSAVSSIAFTVFFWILGHFSEEMAFLSQKITHAAPRLAMKSFYYLVPNFQYFNLRDFWDVPNIVGPWMLFSGGYGIVYTALVLACALWLFARREF